MNDTLHRLYRTKLALLAVVLICTGLALMFFGYWTRTQPRWSWIAHWPLVDIGSALFTTGLLGVALHYLDGADSEARDTERLTRIITDAAPAMRDAVIDGFAFEHDDLTRVATPDVLDQLVTNALALRLGDESFAADIYDDLREQAIGVPERLHDLRVTIRLSMDRGTSSGRASHCYIATVRWESTLTPVHATRRFACVSDIDEFRDLAHDRAANSAWYLNPASGLDAADVENFELVDFTVDGVARPIRRTSKAGSQTYTVTLGQDVMTAGEPVTISHTYRTRVPIDDHLLQIRIDQPTHGLSLELDYSDTNITHCSILDFIASSDRTRITRAPQQVPETFINLEFDGWAFPRSGVAFVWATTADHDRRRPSTNAQNGHRTDKRR